MSHARAAIRQAVVARLIAANTAAGSRVFDTPADPRVEFPCLVVEEAGETQQIQTVPIDATTVVERTMLLDVTAELQQTGDYAGARDQLVGQAEAALFSAPIAGVRRIAPSGFQPETRAGERTLAAGRQRFTVTYFTKAGDPFTAI